MSVSCPCLKCDCLCYSSPEHDGVEEYGYVSHWAGINIGRRIKSGKHFPLLGRLLWYCLRCSIWILHDNRTLTSVIPVQCSISWTIRPNGSWSLCGSISPQIYDKDVCDGNTWMSLLLSSTKRTGMIVYISSLFVCCPSLNTQTHYSSRRAIFFCARHLNDSQHKMDNASWAHLYTRGV